MKWIAASGNMLRTRRTSASDAQSKCATPPAAIARSMVGFGVALHGVEHVAREGGDEGARGVGHGLRAQAVQRVLRAQRGDRGIDRGAARRGGAGSGAAGRRSGATAARGRNWVIASDFRGESCARARRRAAGMGPGAAAGMREPAGRPPRTTPRDPLGARSGLGAGRRRSGADQALRLVR